MATSGAGKTMIAQGAGHSACSRPTIGSCCTRSENRDMSAYAMCGTPLGLAMAVATDRPDEGLLVEAFQIIESVPETSTAVVKLRDLLTVDHIVYHSSKSGAGPSDPQRGPYIRLTYPASWIQRYLQMGYAEVDPGLREAFKRTLPFRG
jgi:hypothetical protein